MLKTLKALWDDSDGPTTVEYALILVLVCLAAFVAWQTLGGTVNTKVGDVNTKLGTANVP